MLLAPSAGMQLLVEVKQGRRRFLEYLLLPVRRALGKAARER